MGMLWEGVRKCTPEREGTHHRVGARQTNTSCFLTDLATPAPPSNMQTITGRQLLPALPEREYGAMGEGQTPAKPGFRASLCHLATVEFSFYRSSAKPFLPDYRITHALSPLLNNTNAQAFPAILQIWALNTVLLRENFLRSSSLIQTYIPPLQCVCMVPLHADSQFSGISCTLPLPLQILLRVCTSHKFCKAHLS